MILKRVLWSLVAAVIVALATASFFVWRRTQFAEHMLAVLPPLPEVEAWPPAFGDALDAATAKATSREHTLDGVADLGRLYHANGFMAQAETCWRFLRQQQPEDARWPYFLADARRGAGDFAGFESLLRETVARDPGYAPAWLQLATLEFKSGALDAAEKDYERRLSLLPKDPYARLGLARIALERGQRDAARQQLEQLVRASPEFPPGHNLLAEHLAAEGNVARAREHRWLGREAGRFREADDPWLAALHNSCYDPQRLAVLGTMQFQTQRLDRARALLEWTYSLAPHDATVRVLLGDLYLKLADTRRALEVLAPVRQDPKIVKGELPIGFYVTLSEAQRLASAAPDALDTIDAALKKYPGAAELFRQRGLILAAIGRGADAEAAFKQALALNPGDTDAMFQLGLLALAAGRRDAAQTWWQRVLAAQPTHPQALTLLARIELEAGRLDPAWRYLEPLYETNPGLPQVRQLVARWHGRTGDIAVEKNDIAAAERHFRDGLALNPNDADLKAGLGVLYLTQGRFPEALPILESYQQQQPENARAALFLGQTYARLGRIIDARRLLTLGEQLALRAGQGRTAENCREILRQL